MASYSASARLQCRAALGAAHAFLQVPGRPVSALRSSTWSLHLLYYSLFRLTQMQRDIMQPIPAVCLLTLELGEASSLAGGDAWLRLEALSAAGLAQPAAP